MKEEERINAHIAMDEFFDGTTRILTPDNLKVGILSNRKYEDPVIYRFYQELADHYRIALLSTRVFASKDKAAEEGSVGNLTSHVIPLLRKRKFFDIHTMNTAIRKELDRLNGAPFQKKDGSRHVVFLEEEFTFLQPLFPDTHMSLPRGSPAFLGNIDYLPDGHLNRGLLESLEDKDYIPDQEQRDLLELMEYRCGQAPTIFCFQFMLEGWHERLGGSVLADSILDRIILSAYTMRIDGDVFMWKRIIKG